MSVNTSDNFNNSQKDDYDYEYANDTESQSKSNQTDSEYIYEIRMLYEIGYPIICTLGLVLNLLVIIAGSCCNRKSDTAKWVLALAVTHLICSAFLPLQFLYSRNDFNWLYGTVLCKLSSYVFYISLFSTAGILSLWSVIDGVGINRCNGKICSKFQRQAPLIMIMCSWTFAVVLSAPSLYSREVQFKDKKNQCIDDYDYEDNTTTQTSKTYRVIVVCYRFIFGILLPAFLVSICYCCQHRDMEKNVKQIKCLIKLAYFVCWTPLLLMAALQVIDKLDFPAYVLPIATVLAAAHSCINPVIYLSVNHDIKMQWMGVNIQSVL